MKTVFGVTSVLDSISPAVDTSNPAVAELPQKAKVNEGWFAAVCLCVMYHRCMSEYHVDVNIHIIMCTLCVLFVETLQTYM